MDKNIFEEGPLRGHAAGDTSIEQQASQLVSDIKYKVRKKMKSTAGSNLSPAQVQGEYRKLFNASGASGAVKAIAKKKLFGEQIDYDSMKTFEISSDLKSNVFSRIFLEADEKKFVIKVTDRATGNTSYRKGDRAKIAELRANKNISSVEITGRKEVDDAYKGDPKPNYGGKKAKKDYDGDGKVESGSKEHAGVVHNAIQRNSGGVADGQDTRKEEVIYEKEDYREKKLDVMKGKNKVNTNPSISEQIRAELDALKSVKVEEQQQQEDEKKKEALAQQQEKKDKMMKLRILQNKMRAVRGGAEISASHKMQGDTIAENEGQVRYCPKCDKDETRDECKYGGEYWDENSKPAKEEDSRGNYAKINLAKNKLRAMGLKMSYDMEGEMTEARKPEVEAQGKKVSQLEREGRAAGLVAKFRKENPGSRQAKKVPGAKETEGDAANRRRAAQAKRAAKHGLTSRERRESQARAKYDSPRD